MNICKNHIAHQISLLGNQKNSNLRFSAHLPKLTPPQRVFLYISLFNFMFQFIKVIFTSFGEVGGNVNPK